MRASIHAYANAYEYIYTYIYIYVCAYIYMLYITTCITMRGILQMSKVTPVLDAKCAPLFSHENYGSAHRGRPEDAHREPTLDTAHNGRAKKIDSRDSTTPTQTRYCHFLALRLQPANSNSSQNNNNQNVYVHKQLSARLSAGAWIDAWLRFHAVLWRMCNVSSTLGHEVRSHE